MKYIPILIALFFTSVCHAELPDEPTIPDLCKDSKIILAGTIASKAVLEGANDIKFSLMVVSIDSLYKGKDYIDKFPSDTVVGAEINVLIQKTYNWDCPQETNYINNKKYVFFLEESSLENLFTRNESVIYFEEFKANKELLKQIESEISGKNEQEKAKLYSLKVVEDEYDITFTEIERGDNFSIAKVELKKFTSVGSAMFMQKCVYDIAKLRKYAYFFTATQWQGDKTYDWFLKIYFTNDEEIPLEKLLGMDYSEEAQGTFDELGYSSVEDLDMMFGGWKE